MKYILFTIILEFTVGSVLIQMDVATVFVDEDVASGTVSICVKIAALPGELQTHLTVALSTINGPKAGL